MSLLAKVKQSKKVEKVEDRVGGFTVHPTNVYDANIVRMYSYKTNGGSIAVVMEADIYPNPDEDKTSRYNQTFYVTNAQGENFYTSKDGKQHMNSSWLLMDAIALFATEGEAGLGELETEEITIKLSRDGKDVHEEVESYPEVEGLEIKLGIQHINKPKSKKVDGIYVDIAGETVDTNEVNRVFDKDGFTILEWQAELKEPEFIDKWLKTWEGKTRTVKPKATEKTERTGGTGRTASARTPARSSGRGSRFTR